MTSRLEAHRQEPIGVLRQRAEQLDSFPGGKCPRAGVGRPGDEVELSLAHELRAFLHFIDKFDRNALLLEKAELHRRDGNKI